ncbi:MULTISPECIES: roadblock/LC7 domain-containing protein [Nocardiopsis]|mgnify:CR=1 FL=1|uniref:Roadblock/LC7 domain-containing protein n=2 Tax=Nocardiopsis TaxID=2013 RepID=A0ABT4TPL5_9ACTN|nr:MULTISPECIES: roadblock/LC7 domain-containing protein [Nocardiopsis]MDA2806619.1 roadblock/LC7 domain-containing protein [Nocardiopsis suaedae]MDA2812319.1 roadblock/LC7 domain-containing protein [Nocardiopsis endophytica]
MNEQLTVSAEDFSFLVSNFVRDTHGAEHAIVVSSDGLLLTASRDFPGEHAEQLAAIASGLQSLALGGSKLFDKGECQSLIVRMREGHLIVMAISDGSCLAVLSDRRAQMNVVAYEMTRLVERVAHVLTPQLRTELREVVGK